MLFEPNDYIARLASLVLRPRSHLSVCLRRDGKLRVIGQVTEPTFIARILEPFELRERHENAPRAPPTRLAR
ncbi:MAG: hypothetical protein ACI8PT_004723 [Gammaproteobacteria bacterium]